MANRKPLVLGGAGRPAEVADADTLIAALAQFTTLTAGNGTIDGVTIGGVTPAPATFTTATITANLAYGANNKSTDTNFFVNGAAGTNRSLVFQTNGVTRYAFNLQNNAETGSNTGADFAFGCFGDTGSPLFNAMLITRSSGLVTIFNLAATGGSINGTPIGGTTPAAATFTTLSNTGYQRLSAANNLTAAGTTQATALVLAATCNLVTTAASGTGVALPALAFTAGFVTRVLVVNATAIAFPVYPPIGASAAINGGTANTGFSLAAGASAWFNQFSATVWRTG